MLCNDVNLYNHPIQMVEKLLELKDEVDEIVK